MKRRETVQLRLTTYTGKNVTVLSFMRGDLASTPFVALDDNRTVTVFHAPQFL